MSLKSLLTKQNSSLIFQLINDDGSVARTEELKLHKDGTAFILPKDCPEGRQFFSVKKFDKMANGSQTTLEAHQPRTITRGVTTPTKKLDEFLTEDEKAQIDAIYEKAKVRRDEYLAKNKDQIKLELAEKKYKEALKQLEELKAQMKKN